MNVFLVSMLNLGKVVGRSSKQRESKLIVASNRKNRYFVRVTIARRLADVIRERDIWVNSYKMPIEINNSIKMEVGIEDCLHIEFEYNKSK